MKSLLVSSLHFPPQTGGISSYMASIAATMRSEDVCCFTGVRATNGWNSRLETRTYRRPAAFAKALPVQVLGFGSAIAEIMLREHPQVVQLATAYDGYIGLWLDRWFHLPFVVYAHGNEILGAMESSWKKPKQSLVKAARVLANSRFTASLVERVGVSADKVEVIHPGCDIDRFQPYEPVPAVRQEILGNRAGSPVILSVGNLVARKGHDLVIRALPRVLKRVPDAVYIIVGDGPQRAALMSLALTTGVGDRVIFAGHVPDDRLPEVYALSDVFIMPSREEPEECDVEGFGMVFLEASACGKPVVAGRSGGTSDAVVDGVTGLLVNPLEAEEIADALVSLLGNRNLALELGRQGRARVVSEFAWSRIVERVQGILESVVTARAHSRSSRWQRLAVVNRTRSRRISHTK